MTDLHDAQFNYQDHLQLDRLLNAQKPISAYPEEHFFIIVHQAYELWFKQLLFDLRRVIDDLENERVPQAIWLLRRSNRVLDLLHKQLDVLTMMSAADFLEFRSELKEASGLQSRQFRELEVLGGLCDTAGEDYARRLDAMWPGLRESIDRTLHQVLLQTIERCGVSLVDIYQQRWQHFEWFSLCEACIEFDARLLGWRSAHIKMVERMIGTRARGTGGTYGTRYLTSTTAHRLFPELWEVRNQMTELSGGFVYGNP